MVKPALLLEMVWEDVLLADLISLFCWVITIAGLWKTIGFALRVPAGKDLNSFSLFVPQQALIVLPPLGTLT